MTNKIRVIKNFDEKFFREHITFRMAPEVQQLIKPLNSIGLAHFAYNAYYKDGSHFKLVSQPAFTRYYYENALFKQSNFHKLSFVRGEILSEWLVSQYVTDISKAFKVSPSFVIAEHYEDYIAYFHFILPIEKCSQTASLYHHRDILHQFIIFFKDQAKKLIEQADKERFMLFSINNIKNKAIINANIPRFMKDTKIKRFHFRDRHKNIYLTKKELQIIRLLVQGKNLKTIQDMLFISASTIESHIIHIKEKLHCKTLFELGLKTEKLGLSDLYQETEKN